MLPIGILLLVLASSRLIAQDLVITGATLIDTAAFGNSTKDVPNSAIVIRNGTIVAVGAAADISIPKGARVVDLPGKFVVPGFCDSFMGVHNQATADALLYMGVTTVLGAPYGDESGRFQFFEPIAGPEILRRQMITGYSPASAAPRRVTPQDIPLTEEQLIEQMNTAVKSGVRAFHLAHSVRPEQTAVIVRHARQIGAATIGELARTSYRDAIGVGINALLHSPRYLLELADAPMQAAVASEPFGPALTRFYKWLEGVPADSPGVQDFSRLLAGSKTALVPTLAMVAGEGTIQQIGSDDPLLRILGDSTAQQRPGGERRNPIGPELLSSLLRIETALARVGVHYVAGGGRNFGQVPGLSFHNELKMLVRIGLTPRQALAAGTSNFAFIYGFRDRGCANPGCRADLVVINSNPIADVANTTNIAAVYVGGRSVKREVQPKTR